jgi:uncharacterized RDD family membrane protein YckC
MERVDLEYVGFWSRVLAAIIDSLLLMLIIMPLASMILGRFGGGASSSWVLPAQCLSPMDFQRFADQCLNALDGNGSSGMMAGPFSASGILLNYVLPAIAVLLFWVYRQATPGKMAIGARILDAVTGKAPSTGQLIGRYLGYYVSILPLCLGLLWVAFDPRKQGWHDKLAGTVVVRSRNQASRTVKFQGE